MKFSCEVCLYSTTPETRICKDCNLTPKKYVCVCCDKQKQVLDFTPLSAVSDIHNTRLICTECLKKHSLQYLEEVHAAHMRSYPGYMSFYSFEYLQNRLKQTFLKINVDKCRLHKSGWKNMWCRLKGKVREALIGSS